MCRLLLSRVYLVFFVYNVGLNGFGVRRSNLLHFSRNSICKNNVCRNKPDVVPHVMQGLVIALRECQHQFKNRRWNCSEKGNSMEKIMRYDFRESAFALAINAAGVTYAVTRACSLGELVNCNCNAFSYRGKETTDPADIASKRMAERAIRNRGVCDKNIDHGEQISSLIFASKKTKDARTALIRWNYEAGRQALRKLMQKNCKCFGYSGTCTYTACWLVFPSSFKQVGARLKQRFDSATKVTYGNKGKTFHVAEESMKKPTPEDLVYTTDSPSFCDKDSKIGSFGTRGRYCNATSMGTDGCDLMCCQRNYVTTTERRSTYCKCKFVWCCKVKCETCPTERTVNTCL